MSPSTESRRGRGGSHEMYNTPSSGSSSSSTADTAGSISAGITSKVSLSINVIDQEAESPPKQDTMAAIDEIFPMAMSPGVQSSPSSNQPSPLVLETDINKPTESVANFPGALSFIESVHSYSELERQAIANSLDAAQKSDECKSAEELDSSSSAPSRILIPSQKQVAANYLWHHESSQPVAELPAPSDLINTQEPLNETENLSGIPSTIDVSVQRAVHSKVNPNLVPLPAEAASNLQDDVESAHPTPNVATSSNSPSPPGSSKGHLSSASLRRGKWTVEEESYVARVIQDFNSGYLNAPAGTTLRSYLSDKLHCDPMRITKKFTGDSCIGKRVFHPAVRCPSNAAAIDKAQAELDALERRWRRRLEMQQRESAKKAAASAAAVVAGRIQHPGVQCPVTPNAVLSAYHHTNSMNSQHVKQSAITRTASWLDRANAILTPSLSMRLEGDHDQVNTLPENEIENQMKAVERLLHEGPIIQQATAGLPLLLDGDNNAYLCYEATSIGSQDSIHHPRDKRPRRLSDTGAEDAEALLGFVNTVRAAAAGRHGSE